MTGLPRPHSTELAALRELIQSVAGLIIDESRTDVLVAAAARRMRATGDERPADYLVRLTVDRDEIHELLELVVVRETHFGRIPPQIDALRRVILPDLIRQRSAERRLRIWSAGCSTGEEVWTLAMLLGPLLPSGWDVQILGTDLSAQALQLAEQGRYGPRAVAQLPPDELQRWFTHSDETYEVSADLRPLVRFLRHNLVIDPSPLPPGERADLIVCRNVTIYFDRSTTRRAVDGFRATLAADGWLMMGPSETLWRLHDGFEVVSLGEAFAYRRQADQPAGPERRLPAVREKPRIPTARRTPTPAPLRMAAASVTTAPLPEPAESTADPAPAADLPALELSASVVRGHLLRGEYEAAVVAAQTLIDREPLSAESHYLQAVALVDLGRDRAALQPLRRAVYLAPRSPLPQFLLGTVLARLGHTGAAGGAFAAAERALRESADLDATVPELDGRRLRELADVCRQLCAGEPVR